MDKIKKDRRKKGRKEESKEKMIRKTKKKTKKKSKEITGEGRTREEQMGEGSVIAYQQHRSHRHQSVQ